MYTLKLCGKNLVKMHRAIVEVVVILIISMRLCVMQTNLWSWHSNSLLLHFILMLQHQSMCIICLNFKMQLISEEKFTKFFSPSKPDLSGLMTNIFYWPIWTKSILKRQKMSIMSYECWYQRINVYKVFIVTKKQRYVFITTDAAFVYFNSDFRNGDHQNITYYIIVTLWISLTNN